MNIAKMSPDQRAAIQADKARSLKCHEWLKLYPRWKIRAMVEQIPEPEQTKYRETLNRMIGAKNAGKKTK